MKLDPAAFENEEGFKRMADLIRIFVDQKVERIQIRAWAKPSWE
jgi:hypothetical protein